MAVNITLSLPDDMVARLRLDADQGTRKVSQMVYMLLMEAYRARDQAASVPLETKELTP